MAEYRTIIETERYRREKQAISSDERLLDEVLEDATSALAWHPMMGRLTDVEGILAVPVRSTMRIPRLVIYYTYSHDEVQMLSIRRAEEAHDEI